MTGHSSHGNALDSQHTGASVVARPKGTPELLFQA